MIPFPSHKHKIIQKKSGPFVNNCRVYDKIWDFGYLDPKQHMKESEPCLHINNDCIVKNFEWKGCMGGIHIGSNYPNPMSLRFSHKNINVSLENCFCEDVGKNALTTFNCHATVKNCAFRGNWKLNPLIENGVGQGNLVVINGGEVTFENCWFFNSINPIIVNTNSKIILKNCYFSVCNIGIVCNGNPNPRKNDEFFGGKEGQSYVKIVDCDFFKVATIGVAEKGGTFITDLKIRLDGGKVEYGSKN